jgi:pyruvate/2-oxoglutarate dehydrogenase complex dihydrolipoamide acyltransferase (E2) component
METEVAFAVVQVSVAVVPAVMVAGDAERVTVGAVAGLVDVVAEPHPDRSAMQTHTAPKQKDSSSRRTNVCFTMVRQTSVDRNAADQRRTSGDRETTTNRLWVVESALDLGAPKIPPKSKRISRDRSIQARAVNTFWSQRFSSTYAKKVLYLKGLYSAVSDSPAIFDCGESV